MNVPVIGPTEPTDNIGPGVTNFTPENALDRTAFLTLLLAQLANQDPLEPMSDQDFIAQLAQFSSLERLEEISGSIQELVDLNQKLQASNATSLDSIDQTNTSSTTEPTIS